MDILGVGPLELIVILIVMMLVFGPDRLPEMGAKLGKGLRGMRRVTREFSREIEATRAAVNAPIDNIKEPLKELAEPFEQAASAAKKVAGVAQAAKHPGRAIQQSLKQELSQATEGIDIEAAVLGADDQPDGAPPVRSDQDADGVDVLETGKQDNQAARASQAVRDRARAIEESLKESLKRELTQGVADVESESPAPGSDSQPEGKTPAETGQDTASDNPPDEAAPATTEANATIAAAQAALPGPEPRISPFDDASPPSPADQAQAGAPQADASPIDGPGEPAQEA